MLLSFHFRHLCCGNGCSQRATF